MNYDDKLSSGGDENLGLGAEVYDTSKVRKSKLGKATAAIAAFSLAMLADSAMAQDANAGIDGFVDLAMLDGIASVTRLPDGGLEILLSDGRTVVLDAVSVQSVGSSIFVSQTVINAEGLIPSVVSDGTSGGSGFGTVGLYVSGAAGIAGAAMAGIGGGGSAGPAIQEATGKVNAVPEFEAPAPVNAAENSIDAFQKIAVCSDGDVVTYSLSGTDAELFDIDVNTGVVTFKEAPNFENPSDANGDNVYEVVVSATDGEDSASLSVNVTVTDVVEAQNLVGTADADNFVGSEEADTFSQINDGDSVQGLEGDDEISITGTGFTSISGGEGQDTLQIGQDGLSLDLTNQNSSANLNSNILSAERPDFASLADNISGIEIIDFGTSFETSITLDAGGIASLTEQRLEDGRASIDIIGANGGFVDLTSGNFTQGSPVTENGITYIIYIDGNSVVRIQDTITVDFIANQAPVFTFSPIVNLNEGGTLAYLGESTDADGDTLTYSLSGIDADVLTIDSVTGFVLFNSPTDFEAPVDSNGDNVYEFTVTVTDGVNTVSQNVTTTILNINDSAPVVTSANAVSVSENTDTGFYTATADDADGDAITFTLSGIDSALFTIDAVTGVVSFIEAPDFEAPADANGDNVYDIVVEASDGEIVSSQSVAVTVTDDNDNTAPVFTFNGTASFDEGQTLAYLGEATDADGDTLTYSISGIDAGGLTINAATGVVSFNSATDFEAPTDANGDNVYEFTVTVSDGVSTVSQNVTTTINNVNDSAPVFSSPITVSLAENTSQAYTAVATDADGDAVSFSLSGTDSQHFSLDSTTGVLTFIASPDFETPADGNGDNVYDVIITASDGAMTTAQAVAITVTNENDNAPVVTSPSSASVNENISSGFYTATAVDADGDTLIYTLSGVDASLFTLDAATGVLSFITPPDFEVPSDANGDNIYDVIVTASDGTTAVNQSLAVTVTNENDNAPVFVPVTTFSIDEATAVVAIPPNFATDADGDAITYSISGVDAGLATFDAVSGLVTFIAPPDFEVPSDANGDNVYEFIITASDGLNSVDQVITVNVTNENDNAPVITSPITVNVPENSTAAYTVTAADADGDTIAYSLSGADASFFSIDINTGQVNFIVAPDFDGNRRGQSNNYDIIVTASDGVTSVDQAVTISVTNENDNAPVFSSDTTASVIENTTAAYTADAGDLDGDTIAYTLSGADASLFSIDVNTGVVNFLVAPDFEVPTDANGDNVYDLVVTASDGVFTTNQAVAITVANADDNAPVFSSPSVATVAENVSGTVLTAMASDADGDAVTYALSGVDAGLFNIDANTGVVTFIAPPDFEVPTDANGDNIYEFIVIASGQTSETVSITVTNENDNAPVITSPTTATIVEPPDGSTAPEAFVAYTAVATDADGDTISYSLSGTDASLFTIDTATGVVSFITLPDFEAPADSNGDNVYDVVVTATDGTTPSNQPVSITVTNQNDNVPVITSPMTANVAENASSAYTVTATDADGDTLTYSLSGADAALFNIDPASGLVSFITPPDHEAPGSAQGTNDYVITVTADDGAGQTIDQIVTITVTNVDDNAPVFSSPSVVNVVENVSGTVLTAMATDADGDAVTYALSGVDAGLFNIDANTGVVTFIAPPDFEVPTDANGDNIYEFIVIASGQTSETVSITVTNENDNAPVITSPTTATIVEPPDGSTAPEAFVAYTAVATDADGDTISYSLSGTDASLFTIDTATGVVSFITLPDFEAPADSNGDNVYDVVVTATDGTTPSNQPVSITVTNQNDNVPVITSPMTANVAENASSAYTVTATDADGDTLTYSLSGADAALFNIDPASGLVSFITPPDHEAPGSAQGTNDYVITVTADDGAGQTIDQIVTITVTNVDDNAPVFSSPSVVNVVENVSGTVLTAMATDADGDAVTYALSGVDAGLFNIDANTGVVTFIAPPDFEVPTDANGDNIYEFIVIASGQTSETVSITVTNENDNAPVITSPTTATIVEPPDGSTAPEAFVAYTAVATDADGDTISYSLSGTDASLFTIDTATGVVSFITLPDFEAPADSNGDNVYDVVVTATDGTTPSNQPVSITVTNQNDNVPVITSPMTANVAENASSAYTVTATDADGDTLTYSLSGADAALFNIDPASGLVSFITPPDHEAPGSAQGTNDYVITVTADDGAGQTIDQIVTITVTNVDDNAPVFSSPSVVNVVENVSGTVLTAMATDADGDAVTYALSGVDAGLFNIDANTGVVTFIAPPDFEVPTDANGDNIYEFIVIASGQTSETVSITVTNENDNAPVITSPTTATIVEPPDGSTAPEAFVAYTAVATDADGDTISYSLSGTDASLFTIDTATGVVSFITLPDFEAPADSNGDNVYDVVVTATDGTTPSNQPVSITVTNQNDNVPVITSPMTANVAENASSAYTVTATDADGDTLTYSLSGADAALFNIDPASGLVSFITPPDHEAPGSAQGTNDYVITVTADDGAGQTIDQIVTITVTNVDDNAPVFSSPSVVNVVENVSGTVLTAMATDADGDAVTYALSGVDAGLFNIDANTGVVTFIAPPDFEVPTDESGDNIYEFVVIASGQTTETVSITVVNENDSAPVFTSGATATVAENQTAAYTATTTDADGSIVTYSLSGADAALFSIDTLGVVEFLTPPDFEAPADAGGDNVYDIIVNANDGVATTPQAVTITVTNENDSAPVFTSGGTATVAENQTAAYTATTTDADGSIVTYSLSGADAALFSIDTLGVVEFLTPPDFEAPADAGGDNVYDIIVNANDGVATTPQAVTITVTDDPSLADLDGTNGFRLDGINVYDSFGFSVSSAGDVNGDGFDDLLIGAPHSNASSGHSYVVYGGPTLPAGAESFDLSTLDGTNGFRVEGENGSDYSGFSVSSAGDVNGDGFDDLIIGASGALTGSGAAYVMFGGATSPGTAGVAIAGTNGFRIDGENAGDQFGFSVSSAGDVNGDGFDDLIVGANFADPNGDSSAGESYVVFGGAAIVAGGELDLSNLDGTNGFRLEGIDAFDRSGYSVSSAGDVNGDGFDDLIIGAYGGDPNSNESAGETYVVFGSATSPAVFDLTTLDGTNGFRLDGIDTFDSSGQSVSSAGDVNGDGFDDLIIAARNGDPNGNANAGETYIVFGGAIAPGTAGVFDLSTLDGTNGFRIDGVAADDQSGFSVSSAGDINGDGFDDIIIGAQFANSSGIGSISASYVVFGGATAPGIGGVFDLATLDGVNGFRLDRIDADDSSGISVSSAGDVNGDGFDDLIIGSNYSDPNGDTNAGESYVIYGGATGTEDTAIITLAGTGAAENFTGNAGNDTFTGISTDDVVRGGAGDDVIAVTSLDFADIRGGTGKDNLVLDGAGLFLDTTTAGNAGLSSIEIIDITGTGNNTLTLNAQAVFDLTEERDSGTASIDVLGNAGDTVNLQGWASGAQVVEGGITFNVFTDGNAVVRVQDGVTVSGALVSVVSLVGLDGTNGFRLDGIDAGDFSGASVSSAGDVNGDGFDDFIIGAVNGDTNGVNAGESYVVFGGATVVAGGALDLSTLDGTNGFRIDGIDSSDRSGSSVSSAGDINGDGFDDLIIGAHTARANGDSNSGESYVVFGGAALVAGGALDLSTLDGTNGFRLDGIDAEDRSGRSVSSAGDINGDGYDDLIISGYGGEPNGDSSAGESYVVFGGATVVAGGALDLSTLDGTNGFRIDGIDANDNSGRSVSSAGDVNGDGFDDLIIAARYADPNGDSTAGESYVVFGGAAIVAGGELDLSNLDGTNGFRLEGIDAFDRSGYSVSSAGDVNGDGFDDLIIGANLADPNFVSSAGESYVVFGGATVVAGGALDLSTLDGTNGFRIDGVDTNDNFGFSVSSAGDVNGDGFDDLIIGASLADPNGASDAGESYVVFGGSSVVMGGALDLSTLDGTNGFRIDGIDATDNSGGSVSSAGDVNGDGFDDLIIGARSGDPNGDSDAGESYIVFGGATGTEDTAVVTSAGTGAADNFTGNAGDDDFTNISTGDVVRGGAGDDNITVTSLDFADIRGGSGIDLLVLNAAGVTLDVTTAGNASIGSIEIIDITGSGNNTIIVNAQAVFDISEERETGTAGLDIRGDAGDTVDLTSGNFFQIGSEMIDGFTYNVYEQGPAVVRVQDGVTVVGAITAEPLDDTDGPVAAQSSAAREDVWFEQGAVEPSEISEFNMFEYELGFDDVVTVQSQWQQDFGSFYVGLNIQSMFWENSEFEDSYQYFTTAADMYLVKSDVEPVSELANVEFGTKADIVPVSEHGFFDKADIVTIAEVEPEFDVSRADPQQNAELSGDEGISIVGLNSADNILSLSMGWSDQIASEGDYGDEIFQDLSVDLDPSGLDDTGVFVSLSINDGYSSGTFNPTFADDWNSVELVDILEDFLLFVDDGQDLGVYTSFDG